VLDTDASTTGERSEPRGAQRGGTPSGVVPLAECRAASVRSGQSLVLWGPRWGRRGRPHALGAERVRRAERRPRVRGAGAVTGGRGAGRVVFTWRPFLIGPASSRPLPDVPVRRRLVRRAEFRPRGYLHACCAPSFSRSASRTHPLPPRVRGVRVGIGGPCPL